MPRGCEAGRQGCGPESCVCLPTEGYLERLDPEPTELEYVVAEYLGRRMNDGLPLGVAERATTKGGGRGTAA